MLLDLALKSGVKFIAQHNHTTVDVPETVYFVRDIFKQLYDAGIEAVIKYPEITFWHTCRRATVQDRSDSISGGHAVINGFITGKAG